MPGMTEMILEHILQLWVSEIAHIKLREPRNLGCQING